MQTGRTIWLLLSLVSFMSGNVAASILGPPSPPRVLLPGDNERSFTRTCTGPTAWQVSMGGSVDGVMARGPMQVWRYSQTWQPNLEVVITNLGTTAVRSPRLIVNGERDWPTLNAIVADATAGCYTPAEKARGIWEFVRGGMFSAYPSTVELNQSWKAFNCYGFGLCSETTVVLGELWRAAGLNTRLSLYKPNHVTAEVFYDGGWHHMDATYHALLLDWDNQTVTSGAGLAADPALVRRGLFGGLAIGDDYDQESIRQYVASIFTWETGVPHFRQYPADMPAWELLPGASLAWRWSHVGKHYSYFANAFSPSSDANLFSNGQLLYEPDLATAAGRLGLVSETNLAPPQDGVGGLRPADPAIAAEAVWKLALPWPMVGGRLDVDLTRASVADGVSLSVSRDGLGYSQVAEATDPGSSTISAVLDTWLSPRTSKSADRELWVRLATAPQDGQSVVIDQLSVALDVQMNLMALPELRLGANQVEYRDESAGPRQVRVTQRWIERTAWQPPGTPQPLAPTGGMAVDGTGLTFSWSAPASPDGVAQYQFELSDRADMKWSLTPFFERFTTAPYWALPQPGLLRPGVAYWWRVRAASQHGVWGPWSPPASCSVVQPATPVDVRLTPLADGSGYRLEWQPGVGGQPTMRYRLYGSDEQAFSPSDGQHQVLTGVGSVNTAAEYDERSRDGGGVWRSELRPANWRTTTAETDWVVIGPAAPEWGNRYHWRVVAEDARGNLSAPSAVASLPAPAIATVPPTRIESGVVLDYQPQVVLSRGRLAGLGPNGWFAFWNTMRTTWSLLTGPAGVACDSQTGRLSGAPAVGEHELTLQATTTWNGLENYVWPALPVQTEIRQQQFTLRVAGPLERLVFLDAPTGVAADQPFGCSVRAEDAAGFGLAEAVTLTLEDPAGSAVLTGATTVTAVDGVAVFSGLRLSPPGTTVRLVAAAGARTARSEPLTVGADGPVADSSEFTAAAAEAVADGVLALGLQVTLRDDLGQPVAGVEAHRVRFTAEPMTGVEFEAPAGVSDAQGVLSAGFRTTRLGAVTLTAWLDDQALPGQVELTGVAGPAASLAFVTSPASVTQGTVLPVVELAVRDAAGHVSPDEVLVSLALAPQGDGRLEGATTVAASNGRSRFGELVIDRAGEYRLEAGAPGLPRVVSGPLVVRGPARLGLVEQPQSALAGAPFDLQFEVQDSTGARVPNATPAVRLALSGGDPAAVLDGPSEAVAEAGVARFTGLAIENAGENYTLTATAADLTSVATAPLAVLARDAVRLVFRSAPRDGLAGAPVAPAVVVAVEDEYGNLVEAVAGPVTLALHSGPAGAVLSGATTVNPVDGLAVFDALVLSTAGDYVLTAISAGLVSATSETFSVAARTAVRLVFLAAPPEGVAGQPLAPAVAVGAEDEYGNQVASGPVTISLLAGPAGAALSGATIATPVDGLAVFDDLVLETAGGGYILRARCDGLVSVDCAPFVIRPAPVDATRSTFAVHRGSVRADGSEALVAEVTARDAFDNPVPDLAPDHIVVSGPPELVIGGPAAPTDAQGRATLEIRSTAPGSFTVQAAIGGLAVQQTATAEFLARAVSAAHSTVTAPLRALGADGVDEAVLEVTLRSSDDRPIQASPAELREVLIDGGGLRAVDLGLVTGADGRFTIRLVATAPGTYRVRVRVDGVDLAPVEVRSLEVFTARLGAGLQLIGLPWRAADPSPPAVLGDPAQWRLARYDAAAQAFVPYRAGPPDPAFDLVPGRGLVVDLAAPTILRFPAVAHTGPLELPLLPGWNALANPYDEPLPWDLSAIRVVLNGADAGPLSSAATWSLVAPYAWLCSDGRPQWVADPSWPGFAAGVGAIPRLGGFWVYAGTSGTALRLSPPSRSVARAAASAVTGRNWTASFVARHDNGASAYGVVGVSQAVAGRLLLRQPPPMAEQGVRLQIVDGETGSRLAGEVRAAIDTETVWRVIVTSGAPGEVVVSWPGLLRQLPEHLTFTLTDRQTNRTVVLNTRQSYRFQSSRAGEERLFDLTARYGRLDRSEILTLAATRSRGRGLALTVTLSGPAELRLVVRGLGGRTVKELSRQTAAAGATSLAWDGRDQQGRLVPAGTYQVEATAWSANGALSRAVQTVTIR